MCKKFLESPQENGLLKNEYQNLESIIQKLKIPYKINNDFLKALENFHEILISNIKKCKDFINTLEYKSKEFQENTCVESEKYMCGIRD